MLTLVGNPNKRSREMIRTNLRMATASGHRRGWMKIVKSVDTSKANGYAFEGDFLKSGEADLPIGAIIVEQKPEGSVKRGYNSGAAYRVVDDPENPLEKIAETDDWRRKFLSFRDAIADALKPKELDTSEKSALLARRKEICEELTEIDQQLGYDPVDWSKELSIEFQYSGE